MTGVFMGGREITTEEIDTILEKITAKGFANLTEQEKRILYEVSKKLD
jgi:ribosome maturation protein Sdo1